MVRLSMVIQSNDRGSGLKTALPDRFTGLQKKIIWRLFFDNAPFIHEDNPVRVRDLELKTRTLWRTRQDSNL